MVYPENCVTTHIKPFAIQELESKVDFRNPDSIEVDEVKVDDCVIKSGTRCDYLIDVDSTDRSILVELKGADIDQAYHQLRTTQQTLKDGLKGNLAWIICYSGKARLNQIMHINALADYNATLYVESSPCVYDIREDTVVLMG